MAATQAEKDIYKAKLWVKNAPGWIKNLELTGQTANAEHWKTALTWAEGVVAAAGIGRDASVPSFVSAPAYAAQSAPAVATPAVPAPRQRTAAEVKALQLDACTQVWRAGGKAEAAQLGVPDDVFRMAGAIIQNEATASWDGIIAEAHGRQGVPPRGQDDRPAPRNDHGWGDIVAAGNLNVGRDATIAPGASRPSPSQEGQSWDAICTKLNAEDGVAAPDRMPNGSHGRRPRNDGAGADHGGEYDGD